MFVLCIVVGQKYQPVAVTGVLCLFVCIYRNGCNVGGSAGSSVVTAVRVAPAWSVFCAASAKVACLCQLRCCCVLVASRLVL